MPPTDSTAPIDSVTVDSYTVPTEKPESDGTYEWHATTLVVAHIDAAGRRGLGYGYADRATACLIRDRFVPLLAGRDALAIAARRHELAVATRNLGRPGIVSMAMSVVDAALWDLKGKLFDRPLAVLLGDARLRDRAPGGISIAAGEYGYDLPYFRRMLEAGAVDILQADATRCGGISGFLGVAALCEAYGVPLSSHCAPALHVPLCCAAPPVVHLEYFHDHVRIERLLFDGAPQPRDGLLSPRRDAPGLGLVLKERDAACFRDA